MRRVTSSSAAPGSGVPLALLALLCAAPALRAEPAPPRQQPLGLRTQGVLRELFLDPILIDARPLEQPEVDLRWALANSWSLPTQLRSPSGDVTLSYDEQADSLTASLRAPWSRLLGPGPVLAGSGRGLYQRLSSSVEWRATLHWGGWSDGPIEAWHGLVGAFDYERDAYPRNQLELLLRDSQGTTAFSLHSAALALGDVVTRQQLVLLDGDGAALSARLDLKLPTGRLSRAGSSGGVDVAGVLTGSASLSSVVTAHGQVALSRFSGFSAPLLFQPKEWHFTADVSFAFDLGWGALLVEDRVCSPLFGAGWDRLPFLGEDGILSSALYATFRTHNQVSFGLRFGEWSLWLSEDFTPGDNPHSILNFLYVSNSPDVVLGLAWSHPL